MKRVQPVGAFQPQMFTPLPYVRSPPAPDPMMMPYFIKSFACSSF